MGENKNRNATRVGSRVITIQYIYKRHFLVCKSRATCNYANDATVCACHPDLGIIVRQLEDDCSVIVKWFSDNLLKLKDEKCHLMVFGDKSTETTINIGNSEIKESDYDKLLGITFGKKLTFKKH